MRANSVQRTSLLALALALTVGAADAPAQPLSTVPTDEARARALYGLSPLAFEPRDGEAPAPSAFVARGQGYGILLTPDEVHFRLHGGERQAAIRMRLVGASRSSAGEAVDPLPTLRHYLLGNDPAAWRRNVRTYGRVRYRNAWRGIDVVHYGNQRELEFDFVVLPGADPSDVWLAFDGVDGMAIDRAGDLVLSAGGGSLHVRKPLVYQDVEGRRQPIAGAYVKSGRRQVRFRVANYDATRPLIIDPVVQYATYLGGSADDGATAVAVDDAGNAYLTGWTSSMDFPEGRTPIVRRGNPKPDWSPAGMNDVFVAKIDPSNGAASLVYVTVVGGRSDETGRGIALGPAVNGNVSAYVAGETRSSNFPTTLGAYQPVNLFNASTGFVFRLDSSGSILEYSTYLGSYDGVDRNDAIVVDGQGAAYVMGITNSSVFPWKPPLPPVPSPAATWYSYENWLAQWTGSPNPFAAACRNAMPFVAKLDPTGAQIDAWTFLPGCSSSDPGRKLSRNTTNVWVTFRYDARLTDAAGTDQVAVVRFDPLLTQPALFKVRPGDVPSGIDVNEAGDAFVTGQSRFGGSPWLTKLGAGGYTVTGPKPPIAVKADAAGNAHVAWGNFGLRKYSPTGGLLYSIPFRGIRALDVKSSGVYAAGATSENSSVFFPSAAVQANAFDPTCGTVAAPCGATDAFLARFVPVAGAANVTFATNAGAFDTLAPVAEADLPTAGKPAGVTFPFGFFAWTVTNLAVPSVTITMTFPAPVPTGAVYWKVINGTWTDVTTLLGSDDGDNVLTLTIADGGLGDADGLVNGQISDPGGVGFSAADVTPPQIQCAAPDGAWHATDVSLACTASDAGSGLANAADASFVLATLVADGTETSNATTGSRQICDAAGNCATAGPIAGNKVDKKAPSVVCRATPDRLWPANHQLVAVSFGVTVEDARSGPAGFTLASVVSNEPDNGLGDGDTAGDIQGFTPGTPDTNGWLRAERSGTGTGRRYTVTYVGADTAGNTAACSAIVTVPRDLGRR